MSNDRDLDGFEVFAWIGEDEFGGGVVGIKAAFTAVGLIPMVAIERSDMDRDEFTAQLERLHAEFGKTIRLVRLTYVETVKRIGT